ncbi:uncharacterized protein LOC120342459 [Styela clava]|uniref:uncharacterized protein LOC120342459 n=1 Tax=Styela clava TaxID=7725 RepID=UPI00193A4347|nr:uncharacterized protein LOC120342459 [Styela clava]
MEFKSVITMLMLSIVIVCAVLITNTEGRILPDFENEQRRSGLREYLFDKKAYGFGYSCSASVCYHCSDIIMSGRRKRFAPESDEDILNGNFRSGNRPTRGFEPHEEISVEARAFLNTCVACRPTCGF